MNCQEMRTAIDTASRRDPLSSAVKTHTVGCPDCRRHADESRALMALLSAQPRVQAPADFDFKLRARIARAQVQPRGPVVVLQSFWTRSFSWTQAAAATALALVATFTAIQFTSHKESIGNQNGQNIATNIAPAPQVVPAPVETSVAPDSQAAKTSSNIRPTAVKSNARTTRPAASAAKAGPEISRSAMNVASVASNDNGQRLYNRGEGQLVSAPPGNLYGAESLTPRMTKASYVPSF